MLRGDPTDNRQDSEDMRVAIVSNKYEEWKYCIVFVERHSFKVLLVGALTGIADTGHDSDSQMHREPVLQSLSVSGLLSELHRYQC